MAPQERPYEPPLTHRLASSVTLGAVGFLCRTFLYGASTTTTHGLPKLLEVLDGRRDEQGRARGLITVSNHVSVLDDPMIWGVLPFRYLFNANGMRWSLGSYDICFKNGQSSLLTKFFTYGQTLPMHRLAHSIHGGLFQPTMTECIRLLSDPHGHRSVAWKPDAQRTFDPSLSSLAPSDPFSASVLTYTTNGRDSFPSPAAYPSRRHSWVHIFPEGMIHQHPDKVMRYFKWGIARLILEAEPCPDVLPMWIDGPQEVMNERREWPRPLPRPGKKIEITFGELLDREVVLEPLRRRWRALKERARRRPGREGWETAAVEKELGVVEDEQLRYGPEAEQLRIEVTLAIRNEVLKLRRERGFSDEDPKRGFAETFRREGPEREGVMEDESVVKDT